MEFEYGNYAGFTVAGIAITTSNDEAMQTIPKLWQEFESQQILSKVPQRLDDKVIYSVYTNYESDENGKYQVLVGTEVQEGTDVESPLKLAFLSLSRYAIFDVADRQDIAKVWQEIWQLPLKRTYQADFEYYGPKGIKIYVGVEEVEPKATISDF